MKIFGYSFLLFCASFMGFSSISCAQTLFINEIVASNTNDQMDEFFEYDDWLEIYNAGGILNLAGYFLSDDPDSLDKYLIPNDPTLTTVLPNSHIVFWCDNDNTTQGANHTNFTLKSSGESVFLTAPDGVTIIDSVSYLPLATDISYGRTCDGCPTWQYFNNTTWNADNQEIINMNGELLFINEIQTVNTNTIHDLQFEYEPWMEIYNPNSFQVNLASYIIQANGVNFTIPATAPTETIIPAGQFRVVWFDNDISQGAMHLNLSLNATSNVKILAPNGTTVVDNYSFGAIPTDQSWGRNVDGGVSSMIFTSPTPTASNTLFVVPGAAVKINEVMAKNVASITDNFTEFEDWIEIYNPLSTPINLGGYYLSDNPEIRNKWQIPSTYPDSVTIPAGGWKLYFCDGDLNQGVLHANFSLSNGGEYAGIFSTDGFSLVDEVQWDFMGGDTTYGRQYDGYNNWIQFTTSNTVTPGTSNGTNPNSVENVLQQEIAVYPNPSADEIRWNAPQDFRLYDVQGNLVMQGRNQVFADIRKLASGNYFVVFGNNKGVKIEKI
jgi:LEA14-like dessication related protein